MEEIRDRFILFNIKEEVYAFHLEDVAEVMEPQPIFPIPHAPGFFQGIMNFHGSLVSVIDIADYLQGIPCDCHGQLLVLDSRIANMALWADSVQCVRSGESYVEEKHDDDLVEKVLKSVDGDIKVLSPEKLVDRIEAKLVGIGKSRNNYKG